MKITFLSLALAFLAAASLTPDVAAERKNWVVIIAGAGTYGNYRHQANACHAYQIAHKNGIPDEQIVVMFYDDAAYSKLNPVQGNLINKPDGPNVYTGVPKDYTGEDVTAENFLAVLKGDKEKVKAVLGREGKVLESGPDDHVFVYYTDHGGPGIVGMPTGNPLKSRDLNAALKAMHADNKYAKLVFYMEACHSGSMFEDILTADINVYVNTAANTTEPSYARYCPPDDTSGRETCLGDWYSGSWLDDLDTADLHTETLQQEYELVKKETIMSHVQQYGDTSFANLPLEQFFANGKERPEKMEPERRTVPKSAPSHGVPIDMAGIVSLQSLATSSHPRHVALRTEIKRDLQAQLWLKAQTTQVLTDIASRVYTGMDVTWALNGQDKIRNWDCYGNSMDRLFELCPRLSPGRNDFILGKMNVLVNLCNTQTETEVVSAIEHVIVTSPLCF